MTVLYDTFSYGIRTSGFTVECRYCDFVASDWFALATHGVRTHTESPGITQLLRIRALAKVCLFCADDHPTMECAA